MIVIKFGGSVLNELHPTIIDDIRQISQKEKLVLVHGGGNEVTNVATKAWKGTEIYCFSQWYKK